MTNIVRKYSTGEMAFFAAYDRHKDELPQGVAEQSRIDALNWIKSNGIPTKRVESYHYSDLRRKFSKAQNYQMSDTQISFAEIKSRPSIAAFDHVNYVPIVFMDGKLRLDLSDISKIEEKISLHSLGAMVTADRLPECLAYDFKSAKRDNAVDNLTRVMWRDGIILRIKQSIASDLPIHLIFVSTGKTDAAHFSRHSLLLAANSSATLIESHINLTNDVSFNLHHFTSMLSENSELTHFTLNSENKNAVNICRTHGIYSDGVKLNSISLAVGGAWSRREGDLICNGSGMDLKLSGAVLASAEQHVDNSYVVHHKLPENTSFQRFKNVVDDKAHAIFQGKVIVSIDAQKTDGQQMAQTILLSDDAEISCKPELEIYADDVECAHGATVGALDEDMLFYLRARGIPLKTAQRLLIHAFISEITDPLFDNLKQAADSLITKWLSQHLDN